MLRFQAMALAATLLAAAMSGCSRSELPQVPFTATGQARDNQDQAAALEAARTACKDEARRKGMASVAAILLLRGRTSKKDYLECMERHGYEAAQ
jgi:hypothetical protein